MKVDVITVAEVKIKRWRWWSDWIDVAVFDWGGGGYLLQMKVSRTNAKRFYAVPFQGFTQTPHASTGHAEDLVQMKKKNT